MTFGESHGAAVGVVIDGVPAKVELSLEDIQKELDRRRPGQSAVTTQRKEPDTAEILSGVFEGRTTGTPLAVIIRNTDQKSKDYKKILNVFRPGHADFTFLKKFGIRDHRGGGRSSGRETAARVMAGAVAKKILAQHGITTAAYTKAVGDIVAQTIDLKVIEQNPVRTADASVADAMAKRIQEAGQRGDSVGGIVEAVVRGCPAGLGDPVFDKLDARLSHAVMSIGAVKGVEFGTGFRVSTMTGLENNDAFENAGGDVHTKTNNAGGILGGISNGEDIILRLAVKPTSSISKEQQTVNIEGKAADIQVSGRHDPCLCPRIVPVVEAMINITLLDCVLIQKSIT